MDTSLKSSEISAEIKTVQEAYVRETLTRALKEQEKTDTKNGNQQTLDEFLNELD